LISFLADWQLQEIESQGPVVIGLEERNSECCREKN
jgi:hypothetical protein